MTTLEQIAEKAGVSRGTVDRVLHGRDGVSPKTAQRVQKLLSECGYTPSRAGRALGTKGPVPIGILLSSEGNPFFADVRRGMEAAANEFSDFPVQLHFKSLRGYQAGEQLAALSAFAQQGSRGILITPVNDPAIAKEIDALARQQVPVATVNTDVENCSRLLYVGCDDNRMGQTAGHLMGLLAGGKGTALVVGGSFSVLGHFQRLRGFEQVLSAEYPAMKVLSIENEDDDALSFQRVSLILQDHPEIDSVYFAAAGAQGGIRACRHRISPCHILISDDTPPLRCLVEAGQAAAALCQQPFQQGYQAMKALLQQVLMGQPPENSLWYTGCEIKMRYNL